MGANKVRLVTNLNYTREKHTYVVDFINDLKIDM